MLTSKETRNCIIPPTLCFFLCCTSSEVYTFKKFSLYEIPILLAPHATIYRVSDHSITKFWLLG